MLNKQQNNLQIFFLRCKKKQNASIFISNQWISSKRTSKGFDNFTVILDSEGKQMMVYKHAITTISPNKPILFTDGDDFGKEDES